MRLAVGGPEAGLLTPSLAAPHSNVIAAAPKARASSRTVFAFRPMLRRTSSSLASPSSVGGAHSAASLSAESAWSSGDFLLAGGKLFAAAFGCASSPGPQARMQRGRICFRSAPWCQGNMASTFIVPSSGAGSHRPRPALAERGPIIHEVPALLEKVAAPIGGLDRVV